MPGRLEKELEAVARIWAGLDAMPGDIEQAEHPLNKHLPWMRTLMERPAPALEQARAQIRREVGDICVQVLKDCAVFKEDSDGQQGLRNYLAACGAEI